MFKSCKYFPPLEIRRVLAVVFYTEQICYSITMFQLYRRIIVLYHKIYLIAMQNIIGRIIVGKYRQL